MRTTAVLLAAVAVLSAGCGRSVPTAPGMPTDVGPEAAADRLKLQGVWSVESLELAGQEKPDPARFESVRFIFDGTKFRIAEHGRSYSEQFAFALDTALRPKLMILTELSYDGLPYQAGTSRGGTFRGGTFRSATARGADLPVARQEWIYKFDGDTLVVAFRAGRNGGRPSDFKADNGQPGRVAGGTGRGATARFEQGTPPTIVVRLKKTTEAPPQEPTRTFATARSGPYGTRK